MDDSTNPLTEFLLARIAEDEYEARKWQERERRWPARRVLADCEARRWIVGAHSPRSRTFVAHEGEQFDVTTCPRCRIWGEPSGAVVRPGMADADKEFEEPDPCGTLRALASAYADHPDYRREWKP